MKGENQVMKHKHSASLRVSKIYKTKGGGVTTHYQLASRLIGGVVQGLHTVVDKECVIQTR